MKQHIIFFSVFIFQLHAQTFDEFRKAYINTHSDFIVEAIEVANKNSAFVIPKPELAKAAQELHQKGVDRYLSDNYDECAHFPHEGRCLVYTYLDLFLKMSKEEALTYTQKNLEKAETEAAWEEKWKNNNHHTDEVEEAQNRLDAFKEGIALLKTFLDQAKNTD